VRRFSDNQNLIEKRKGMNFYGNKGQWMPGIMRKPVNGKGLEKKHRQAKRPRSSQIQSRRK